MGGTQAPRETQNIARFDREGGFPVWMLIGVFGAAHGLSRRSTRLATIAMLSWVLFALGVWWWTTHHQSRFLLPTALPVSVLAGMAMLGTRRLPVGLVRTAGVTLLCCGAGVLWAVQVTTLWDQARPMVDERGERVSVPPWMWADTLGDPHRPGMLNHHTINTLPKDAKVLLVADTGSLLYLDRAIVYATAFDEDPLGKRLRASNADTSQLVQRLRDEGVTHLWVGWSELDRLHRTYGFDPDVTIASVQALVRGWPVVWDGGGATLFAVPTGSTVQPSQERDMSR